MITYKCGDIFDNDAEVLVNTVNCVGVMGRGIALQFKKRFPENFSFYEKACKRNEVFPGQMLVYETGTLVNPKYIVNFPTKRHWRGVSRLSDIEEGLKALCRFIQERQIKSIALPPLGCGLGGLEWDVVKVKIEHTLSMMDAVRVDVYIPAGAPLAEKMVRNREVPHMTPGRAALVELMRCYLDGLLDPFCTLLEVHKLLYFLQESGEDLKLNYTKYVYGPYAKNLSHVLNKIEGYFISGYADGGDAPTKRLQLITGAYEEADVFLSWHQGTRTRISRVQALVDGFETPFGLELLATVHWVIKHESERGLSEIIRAVYAWNSYKKKFTPRQIELAYNHLRSYGWIEA